MGVIGLWNILSPAANEISLHKLAITEGFMANSGGVRVLRVGVDASGWIFRASYRHGHTKNPELATLFVWCTRLFQLPIAPLFIFDGAGRPKTKRGKQVRGNHHWITHSMKEMLDGFGFAWADAPGEAEAELAWLNKSQIIDAVLTEDSDAIIFGATTVLRTPSAERGEDFVVVVYRAHDIRTHPKIQLELPDLLLVVLLVGGDYSSGLHGCGISTALGLAHAGYGCTLVHGINSNAQQGKLVAFLALWREGIICELRTNRSRLLPKCRPLLAQSIPSDFPDIELIQLYLNPITSEFRQSKEPLVVISKNGPDVVRLARFAEDNFMWGNLRGILNHFSTSVFPGLALYELIEVVRANDLGLTPKPITMMGEVHNLRQPSKSTIGRAPEICTSLIVDHAIVDMMDRGMAGKQNTVGTATSVDKWLNTACPRLRVWLPLAVVSVVAPERLLQPPKNDRPIGVIDLTMDPEVIDLTEP